MTKNNSNWKEIEEEFRKEYVVKSNAGTGLLRYTDADKIIAFFKPYFQEKMHEISLRELEKEHPLYKKEYNELPEIVDNSPKE